MPDAAHPHPQDLATSLREIQPFTDVLAAHLQTVTARTEAAAGDFARLMHEVDAQAGTLTARVKALETAAAEQQAAITALGARGEALTAELSHQMQVRDELAARDQIIRDLVDQVRSLDRFISDIRSIAGTTRMAGLNAAIEAAHAGPFGDGFAIVAAEVRRLSASAETIATSLSGELIGLGTSLNDRLDATTDDTQDIAHAISEFSTAQAHLVEQVSAAGERVDGVVREVSEVTAALSVVTTEVLAGLQFQDISRQATEQVQDALVRVAAHALEIADRLEGRDADGAPPRLVVSELQEQYVMDDQRRSHAAALGHGPAETASAPAIELF